MRMLTVTIASLFACVLASPPALAGGGVAGVSIGTDLTVDPTFGEQGFTVVNYNDDYGVWDEGLRLLPADGGGYWLAGFHRAQSGPDRFAYARLDADGRLDTSFGVGGKMVVQTGIYLIRDAIRVDDRLYVSGLYNLSSSYAFGVACVRLDGSYCPGFGDSQGTVMIAVNAPGSSSEAWRILHRDGELFAIGDTGDGGGAVAIAKLDAATGALDASFGNGSGPVPGTAIINPDLYSGGLDLMHSAAFASNGSVLVGGSAQTDDQQGRAGYVLAFDAQTGALDTTFGTDGYAQFAFDFGTHADQVSVRAIQVQDDGRIVLAGNANHDDEFFNIITNVLLASLQPDGTPTAGFGDGGVVRVNIGLNTEVLDAVVRPTGEVVVSMASNGITPNPYSPSILQSIVQFDPAGAGPTATVSIEYPSLVTPQGRPNALVVDAQDRILVGGSRLWDFVFPFPDADHSLTRLVRDGIFADGFEP